MTSSQEEYCKDIYWYHLILKAVPYIESNCIMADIVLSVNIKLLSEESMSYHIMMKPVIYTPSAGGYMWLVLHFVHCFIL